MAEAPAPVLNKIEAPALPAPPVVATPPMAALPALSKVEGPKPVSSNAIKAVTAKFDNKQVVSYEQPPLDLFEAKVDQAGLSEKEVRERMEALHSALEEYGIKGRVVNFEIGPAVTTYEVQLDPGQEIHSVTARQDEITMRLATQSGRLAYLAGRMEAREIAIPSSPTRGMLD